MALETLPWDPTEHLKTAEDVREYLEAAFEDGDPALIAAALGDVARARGMTEIAREAGISREVQGLSARRESDTGDAGARHKGARPQAHCPGGLNHVALVGTLRPCPAERRVYCHQKMPG